MKTIKEFISDYGYHKGDCIDFENLEEMLSDFSVSLSSFYAEKTQEIIGNYINEN